MPEQRHKVYIDQGHIEIISKESENGKDVELEFIMTKYRQGCKPTTDVVSCSLPFPLKKIWLKRLIDGLDYTFRRILA